MKKEKYTELFNNVSFEFWDTYYHEHLNYNEQINNIEILDDNIIVTMTYQLIGDIDITNIQYWKNLYPDIYDTFDDILSFLTKNNTSLKYEATHTIKLVFRKDNIDEYISKDVDLNVILDKLTPIDVSSKLLPKNTMTSDSYKDDLSKWLHSINTELCFPLTEDSIMSNDYWISLV